MNRVPCVAILLLMDIIPTLHIGFNNITLVPPDNKSLSEIEPAILDVLRKLLENGGD